MKKLSWFALGLVLSTALAGIRVTETPGQHELRLRDGTVVARYGTHEACVAAATQPGEYACVQRTLLNVEGICDTPKPALPNETQHTLDEVKNEDGSITYINYDEVWVAAPYPTCWQMGREVIAYNNDADTSQVMEPLPLIEGLDY